MVLDVVRALGRRWFIVLVGLLLTAGLVFAAYQVSPPQYTARALVLLLPSKADVGTRGNPLLLLSGLEQPAGILASYFSSAPAQKAVEDLSATAEFTVGIDEDSRGPVLAVDVTDRSAESTSKILDYLLKQIPEELSRLQQEVDARGTVVISSMDLAVNREPEADIRSTVRLMIAVLLIGLVATGMTAYAVDSYSSRQSSQEAAAQPTNRRSRRRNDKVGDGKAAQPVPLDWSERQT